MTSNRGENHTYCDLCKQEINGMPRFTETATYCRPCYYSATGPVALSPRLMSAIQRTTHLRPYPGIR